MLPLSPVQASESKKCRSRQKNRIGNSSKRMEITVEDKSHHAPLERVCIKRMSIRAAESSRAQHAALERVCIKIMSKQAEELARSHHASLECVRIHN